MVEYEWLFTLFIVLGLIYLMHFGFYLIGANFYDIWQFRRLRRLPKPHHRKRPLVSILIPAHNEEKAIIRCLESVRKSSVRKLQILVVDDASTDRTRHLVRNYIRKHPTRNIHLLYKRVNGGKATALNHALRRHAKGDFIMMLDADSILHKQAVKNALRYFCDPNVAGVAANVRIIDSQTILGLVQKFEHMIGYRAKKSYTVTNCEFIIGGVASTYRREVLKKVRFYDTDTQTEDIGLSMKIIVQGNRRHKIIYGADVLAMTEGVRTFKALLRQRYRWKLGGLQNLIRYRHLTANVSRRYSPMLTFYRIPMAFLGELLLLMQSFVLLYVIYLSLVYRTPELFVGAYILITSYILWTIWFDEHIRLSRKLFLSLQTPVMYFLFFIMDVVHLTAIVRCLFHPRQMLLKSRVSSTWISPERGNGQVS